MRLKDLMKLFLFCLALMMLVSGCGTEKSADQPKTQKVVISKAESDKVVNYLKKYVSELGDMEKLSNESEYVVYNVDRVPDPDETDRLKADYYHVSVSLFLDGETDPWNAFYVHKKFNEVMFDDTVSGEPMTLDEWREHEDADDTTTP